MKEENGQVEPLKNYYIAYFDLLGYKNFFENNPEKVEDFLITIHMAIKNAKKYLQDMCSSFIIGEFAQVSIQVKIFSDNILLCLERSPNPIEYLRFLAFISTVADIQRNFILQYDLFLRGGITIGELSFNEDFIFGKGLIDAVALEEKAVYPRIIIGDPVSDYALQTHFIKKEDLSKACEIENRAHLGKHISDEELAFCNSIAPKATMESIYLQWRNHLIFRMDDGALVLNYLYYIDLNALIGQAAKEQISEFIKTFIPNDYQKLGSLSPNQKQRLEQHKRHIIPKINEFGKYDDLELSADDKAGIRESILKKYLWVLSFHNYICQVYNLPECMINYASTCDIRFMRMTVQIFENQTLENKF